MPRRHPTLYRKQPFVEVPLSLVANQMVQVPEGVTQIYLTWTNTRPDLYTQIWSSAGSFLGYTNPGVASYIVTGLTANTTYSFYIQHTYWGGPTSRPSNIASATTQQAFSAPTNFEAHQIPQLPAGVSQIGMSWTNFNNFDHMNVYRWGGAVWNFLATLNPGTTTYTDTNLPASSTFYYHVNHERYTNEWYESAPSNDAVATTQVKFDSPTVTSVTLPAGPAGSTQMIVTWVNAQAGDEINIYRYINRGGAGPWPDGWQSVGRVAAGTTQWTDTELNPNETRAYAVAHWRATASGQYDTGIVQWMWGGTNSPATSPIGVSASVSGNPNVGQSQINVAWTNQPYGDPVRVWRRNITYSWGWENADFPPGTTSATLTGAAAGCLYEILVRHLRDGYDTPDNGQNYAQATTQQAFNPPYITSVTAPGSMHLTVNWNNAQAGDYIEFFCDGTYIGVLPPGTTSYTHGNVWYQTEHSFFVRHYRSGYDTANSNTVNGTSLAPTWTVATFTWSQQWYWPANVKFIYGEALGGAGAGGYTNRAQHSAGGGGQGGSYASRWFVKGGEAYLTMIVGGGGASGNYNGQGGPGAASYIDQNGTAIVLGPGGYGGYNVEDWQNYTNGAGGYGTVGSANGDVQFFGGAGGRGDQSNYGGGGGGAAGPGGDGGAGNTVYPGAAGPGGWQGGVAHQNRGEYGALAYTGIGLDGHGYNGPNFGGGAGGANHPQDLMNLWNGGTGGQGLTNIMYATNE